ncbi:prolyl oligopeptidase family serine peptidase [Actinoplanes derwentensis]|uniref:Prolyl oligopeptidase n=1 Tax=Actinoplanes derwentensis TaxID=113562 RepID=A0A1H2A8G4_9ACTN|nr:prolyl oligopeptidase family serine peptidase [Actinoplanes derwentensis]GID88460.1 prolyl oligopeptidase [Actinoplanes derwentensis]SDT42275.1 prolyl oligopeptidase [Actinoplanes derwentensis]
MTEDAYRWLEDLDTPAALEWVTARNAETTATLSGERFARTKDAIREVLDSKDRIPYPSRRGDGLYYDFWTDADHPRGLWRRTTPERFRTDSPEWEVLLDVGALNRAEGENWTWNRVSVLRPGYERCLISLSRGGSDAAVVREFDLTTRAFVDGGFTLPEAKSDVTWIDADQLLVATDFGPGALTSSGYARVVKRWRRGTALSEAQTVFEGAADDVLVTSSYDPTPGFERGLVTRLVTFYRSEQWLYRPGGDLVRIEVPEDAVIDLHREWLLVTPRSEWTAGGVTYPAGVLLAVDLEVFLAGGRDLTVLFEPDERTSLSGWSWTRNHLLLATMRDVRSRIEILTPEHQVWRREPLPGAGEFDHTTVLDTCPALDDSYLLSSEGFLRPATLSLGTVGGTMETLKRGPEFFGTDGMSVRQFFAVSADGTRVPYFVAGGSTPGPTILYGYGGFEVTMTPSYSGLMGRGWLAHGGTYVLAGIRGGGEYGPAWHQAALRENRLRAYEDFAAVAADLVTRGITTPGQLGISGGSNGGLLMGVMLTRYPELFGAVVARVPLLDMRRYTKLLAGKSWIAEYGDPDVEQDWAFLREFSPYQNVRADRAYPPLLLLTSTRDDRVHPAHARKMMALLSELGHRAAYYENVEGGHGGAADNEQAALLWALTFEFLRRELD